VSDGVRGLILRVKAEAPLRWAAQAITSRSYPWRPKKDYIQSCQIEQEPAIHYSSQIKPISYLKANAAQVLMQLAEQRQPLVITQNGEARAVLQDVASFEETQETLVMLKILALGNQDIEAGQVKPVAEVLARLRAKRAKT
jgi:prevent-host-death family protein